MSERIERRQEARDLRGTWDPVWRRKRARGVEERWRRRGGRDAVHRLTRSVVERELGPLAGRHVLEAGCGSGLISLALARAGARVALLDLSPEALALAGEVFAGARRGGAPEAGAGALGDPALSPALTAGRVEALPFADGRFDAVWSAGVLEHLPEEDRLRALAEMFRVTRPGGRVLVLHPYARARVYRAAKAHADRRERWQAGEEEPIETMAHLFGRIESARAVREYSVGFLVQFHFLKYWFDFFRPLYLAWCLFVELVHLPLGWLNRFPGYLLVTVADKA